MNEMQSFRIQYKTVFVVLASAYIVALHTSMALMEIFAWSLFALSLVHTIQTRSPIWFPMWKPFVGLFVSVLIGLLINPAGRTLAFQLGFLRWMALFYGFVWLLTAMWDEKTERQLLQVWVVAMTIAGTYAIFQCLTGIDLIRPSANVVSYQLGGLWRPTGFFSRSLAFAYSFGVSFLTIALPTRILKPRRWQWKTLVIGTLGVLATLSLGAWIALFVVVVVHFFRFHLRKLPVIVLLLMGGVVVAAQFENSIGIKINETLHFQLGHSAGMRWNLWQSYFAMWKDHPWFGVGILQGDLLLPEYYKRLGIDETFVSHSHNILIQWLAGAGVVGLFFFLWIYASVLRAAWQLSRISIWGWSLFLAQIYLLVGGMTENNFFTAIVNHVVIFGWAILFALLKRAERGQLAAPDAA